MQQRCQSLGAVTAAEEDGPFADGKGQAENIPALLWFPAFFGDDTGNGIAQNSFAVAGEQRRGAAVGFQSQPAGLTGGSHFQQLSCQGRPGVRVARNVLKLHLHIPAADHANIFFGSCMKLEQMTAGTLLGQKLPGHGIGLAFHSTAADGAKDSALAANQHLRAGTSGGAALVGDDGHKNRVQFLFQHIQKFCKNSVHSTSLSDVIRDVVHGKM